MMNGISRSRISLAAVMALAAGVFAGCSSSDSGDGGQGIGIPEVLSEAVTVGNDPAAQAPRITFYGDNGARKAAAKTRAAEDFPTVGSEPAAIPADAPRYATPNEAQQDWQNEAKKTAYVLTGGSGQIEDYGGDIYITGDVSTHNINLDWGASGGKGGTIYVMPGARLTLASNCNVQSSTIRAYGELVTADGCGVTLGANGRILVKNNFVVNGRFAVEGVCVVNGDLTVADQLQMNWGSKVKAKCIDVQSTSEQAINLAGELAVRSHLAANGLYMNGGSVYLWPNAMAEINGPTWFCQWQGGLYYYTSEGKTDGHALLKTKTLRANGAEYFPYVSTMFANNLKVAYESQINLDGMPSADDYYIPSDVNHGGCNPGNGHDTPWFDPIAVIETPTHEHHHLSATCIQPAGDKAYVSFHLNEAYTDNAPEAATSKHQGCVEMYDVSETKAQINSWLINEDYDFNHTIVDNGKMYAVGDKKTGATLGIITLNGDGTFGQQSADMQTVALNGNSGNCIIADGSDFRIATNLGFQTINKLNYADSRAFVTTPGSGKHIAKAGNVVATLNLADKGSVSSTGTVVVYNSNGTQRSTFNVGTITPVNAKNVIAIDGNDIYVCLGENGIVKYDLDGNKKGEFKLDYKGKPLANGIAFDSNYIYIAYGGAGVVVVNKADMTKVARHYNTYSANYVAVVNGLVYVAYGRDGVEVLKLNFPKEY